MTDFHPASQSNWNTLNFTRERSDRRWVEIERSPAPLESWGMAMLQGVCAVVVIVSLMAIVNVIGNWR